MRSPALPLPALSKGSRTVTRVPFPSRLWITTSPACRCTKLLTIDRPSPEPSWRCSATRSPGKKPRPDVVNRIRQFRSRCPLLLVQISFFPRVALTTTCPSRGVNLIAFDIRLIRIWLKARLSATTVGQVCADIQSKFNSCFARLEREQIRATFDFGRRRKGLWFDFEFAGAHPGSVENPVDDRQQMTARIVDQPGVFGFVAGIELEKTHSSTCPRSR